MPYEYNAHGIRFEYPENWTFEEKSTDESDTVMLLAPGGAFWMLSAFSAVHPPFEVMDDVARSLANEYDSLERFDARQEFEGVPTNGYDFDFIYLDLVNTAKTRGFTYDKKTYILFYQAEDRDFRALEPVFDAMTISFLRNLE